MRISKIMGNTGNPAPKLKSCLNEYEDKYKLLTVAISCMLKMLLVELNLFYTDDICFSFVKCGFAYRQAHSKYQHAN